MAFARQTDVDAVASQSEVKRLLDLDTTPWYKRPNLRTLYFTLIPAVLGCEMTSGYDGSILNGLQAVGPWLTCTYTTRGYHDRVRRSLTMIADFNTPTGAILGAMNAAFGTSSRELDPCWHFLLI